MIARSLTQTKTALEFKGTKTDEPRVAKIPEETLPKLEAHRKVEGRVSCTVRSRLPHRPRPDLRESRWITARPDSISAAVSTLAEMRGLPRIAAVVSGTDRAAAVRAAIRSGLISTLVTDRAGAAAVLEKPNANAF